MVEMVQVTSWYDCTSKQSRYVQLSVREVSEKSADRNFAFDTPVFCNHDLFFYGFDVFDCCIVFNNICCAKVLLQMECMRKAHDVQFVFVCLGFSSMLCRQNRVCIGKRRLSDSALLCRRAGSKRIKQLSACVTTL